jgi:hypothetical protein
MEMRNPRMKIPILSQILAAIFRRFTLTVPAFQLLAFTPGVVIRLVFFHDLHIGRIDLFIGMSFLRRM